ncbi:unnamed protein product [Phyllotreta striolata]|uniref:Fibronectin type III domain protein n=1 Tax=Phyllotreta striolata TaxID=444603 RepID=A0A9N9TKG1_PHYSR|nr:unnamed protein product [Phyllotreta striolata]
MCLRYYLYIVCILLIRDVAVQITDDDPNTNTISSFSTIPSSHYAPETSMTYPISSSESRLPITIEILRVYVPPGIGNAVKLVWGREYDDDVGLNATYGVHYAKDGQDLTVPKITTTNRSAVIEDLEFCTKYNFAVSLANEHKINSNNIRSVVTYMDHTAPPKNFQVDFEPREPPCLLIRWSASCANIGQAIGYVISAFDHDSTRYRMVTLPASNRADLLYHFQAYYGAKFDIKVSTNFPGSKAAEAVTYKVPNFLQPYKVRVTSNPEAGAFMIYWQEPYLPYFIDRLYYEVYVYRGYNISEDYEKFYVTRPVLIYKGNESLYTFSVGSVSYDGEYRSLFTDPIAADLYGEVRQINVP